MLPPALLASHICATAAHVNIKVEGQTKGASMLKQPNNQLGYTFEREVGRWFSDQKIFFTDARPLVHGTAMLWR